MTDVRWQDRLGKPILDRLAHIYSEGPRNAAAGMPTRPALIELLGDDTELLHRFEIIWPEERGDLW
jgi:hypothetical protein